MVTLPKVPVMVVPTLAAVPLTAETVLVSPASTSVSLVKTLPVALGVPVKAVLPGFTPASTTLALSFTAIGASFAPFTVTTTTLVVPSALVTVKLSVGAAPAPNA